LVGNQGAVPEGLTRKPFRGGERKGWLAGQLVTRVKKFGTKKETLNLIRKLFLWRFPIIRFGIKKGTFGFNFKGIIQGISRQALKRRKGGFGQN